MDPIQQLAQPCEELLQRFHVDTRYVLAHGPEGFDGTIRKAERNNRHWYDLTDEFGVVWSMPATNGLYMDISHHPLARASMKDLSDYPWPDGSDPSRFTGVREQAQRLRRETPYALATGISGVIYEYCWYLRGLEQWYMDTVQVPDFCEALLDRMLAYWVDFLTGFMREVGDLVDVVMIGDDLTGQNGPLFSPAFYRRVVKPRQKKLVQHIQTTTPAKVWYHTCGNCVEYIPDLADNGVDILNPVQTSALGMDPKFLKERFGRQMVFWGGGCDAQHVLPSATPGQIREEVRRNVEIFKPSGGYVFNSIHNIQPGVPPENIVALFDAAYEYGFYESSYDIRPVTSKAKQRDVGVQAE
jgi:uroporphyrinogen decarboxylase